jgi:TetR/AcrR family transcriptional regulator, tetracycline repressor protein
MTSNAATARRAGLDHDEVVDAALALVEQAGPDALTMRRLASALGVTPTTIYWHAGNREALVLAVIRRVADQRATSPIAGSTVVERICTIAEQIWSGALDHPHVTALAHRAGAIDVLERHAQEALAAELAAAGLRGRAARDAMSAILLCVAGFIVAGLGQVDAHPPDRRLLVRTVRAVAADFVGQDAR